MNRPGTAPRTALAAYEIERSTEAGLSRLAAAVMTGTPSLTTTRSSAAPSGLA